MEFSSEPVYESFKEIKSYYFVITPHMGPQIVLHSLDLAPKDVCSFQNKIKSYRFVNFAYTRKIVLQTPKTIAKERFHRVLRHRNLWDWIYLFKKITLNVDNYHLSLFHISHKLFSTNFYTSYIFVSDYLSLRAYFAVLFCGFYHQLSCPFSSSMCSFGLSITLVKSNSFFLTCAFSYTV